MLAASILAGKSEDLVSAFGPCIKQLSQLALGPDHSSPRPDGGMVDGQDSSSSSSVSAVLLDHEIETGSCMAFGFWGWDK